MKFTDAPFVIDKKYAEAICNMVAALRQAFGSRRTVQVVFVTTYGVKDNAYSRELVDRVVLMDDLNR
jgi:hypothetical protein